MSTVPDIRVDAGTSTEMADLIWKIFFESRCRGQSLDIHAPYIHDKDSVRSVVALNEDGIAGGLIVKDYRTADQTPVSMIGFVCVRPENRGKHLSRLLLLQAIDDARERGIAGLILWSGTPQVYAQVGFQPDPRDMFFQAGPLVGRTSPKVSATALDLAPRGLPAFADGAVHLETEAASATLLNTSKGPALVEWSGNDTNLIELLSAAVKGPLWINAVTSDSLPSAIERRSGPPLQVVPSKRLALPLDRFSTMDFPEIRILNRI
jgi:predicted N-acetyltransferase YhbS